MTERRLSDRNAQAEAKARELATQLSLLETQNAEAAAKRARRAAARAADRDAFGLRAAEVAAAKADAEETMRTRSSLNEETAASSQPSETFLDQPTTYFEAETRLEASYDAGRYASTPLVEDDDASDDGGDALSASAGDPRRSQDSFALRRSQDSVARSQDSFAAPPAPIQQSQTEPAWRPAGRDGKLERAWADGTREVKYRNGTTKRCSAYGEVVVSFQNGDTKTTSPEGTVVYFYAAADTTHTTDEVNGIETFEFPNGQYERHFASGEKEIRFPDGTDRREMPTGRSSSSGWRDGGRLVGCRPNTRRAVRRPASPRPRGDRRAAAGRAAAVTAVYYLRSSRANRGGVSIGLAQALQVVKIIS